jgi:sarcosine oxidase, subunit alpha
MLAGAALKFLRRHAIAPGRQVVVATNNDSAYLVARELRQEWANVVALLDSRATPSDALSGEMRALGIQVHPWSMSVDTAGFGALKQVTIRTLDPAKCVSDIQHLACDALLVSGGWSPTLHLFAQAGGKLKFSERARTFEPVAPVPNIELAVSAVVPPSENLGERIICAS